MASTTISPAEPPLADTTGARVAPPTLDSVAFPVTKAGDLLVPVIVHDSCEGEDCASAFRGIACAPTPLRATKSDYAAVVSRLGKGDSVDVDHHDLHVIPGIVVVRRDTLHWMRGDTLRLIRYFELGEWQWWHRGMTWSGQEFWRGPAGTSGFGGMAESDTTGAAAVALRHPEGDEWLHVVPAHGASGWWRRASAGDIRDAGMMRHWDEHC